MNTGRYEDADVDEEKKCQDVGFFGLFLWSLLLGELPELGEK